MTTSRWDTPRQILDRTLFPEPMASALARLRVSIDDCSRWHKRGWLSFESQAQALDAPQLCELEFIRDIARSGLNDEEVDRLLEALDKPYTYDPRVVAYSFTLGWVQSPKQDEPPPPDEVIDEYLADWIDGLAENGEGERLREVVAMAGAALARCQ